MEMIDDPNLVQLFEWDPCKMYRYNGESFVQFVNEPWTAQRHWSIQVSNKNV
jgi:hypothetical protein